MNRRTVLTGLGVIGMLVAAGYGQRAWAASRVRHQRPWNSLA